MNTEQYNECLRQANLAIKRLQTKIERLEKENANLTDDLLETQDQCRQAENKLEDIELFFCDEDGCPIIEPLTSDGLDKWLQAHSLEQQAKGLEDYANNHGLGMQATWMIAAANELLSQAGDL